MILEELKKIAESLESQGKVSLANAVRDLADNSEWSSTLPTAIPEEKERKPKTPKNPTQSKKSTQTTRLNAKELSSLTGLNDSSLIGLVRPEVEFEVFITGEKDGKTIYIKPVLRHSALMTLGDAKMFPELVKELNK